MRGRAAILGVLVTGLAASGCAHLGSKPPALPAQVPAAFIETSADTPTAGGADLATWWTSFHDPVLDALIARVLAGDIDLKQAALKIEEARQGAVIAGARGLPQVAAAPAVSRNRISENAIPIPPGTGGGGQTPSPFGFAGSEFSSYRLGLDASWELDLFGGARAGVAAARARAAAAEWSERDLRVALAAETAQHYLALRAAQTRRALAWAELSRQRELLELVTARADQGLTSPLDVRRQEAEVSGAEARSYPLEAEARAQIHALAVLAGEPAGALDDLLAKDAAVPQAPVPPSGMPADLLRRRPDIRRAEQDVAAAAGDVGVAAADLYPKITLSAQPAMVSTALSTLVDWGSRNYAVSAGLLWPIFEGGALRAKLAQADARQQESLLAYRKTVLVALKDVEDALARYQADEARRGSLQASLESARAAESIARDRSKAGLNPYSDVLATNQAVIAAEDALAQAEAARAGDVVALYAALGGGWSETDVKESAP